MKKLYLSEVKSEVSKHPVTDRGSLTEKDISVLPEPVKRYLAYCGFLGKPKMTNARFDWEDVHFRRRPDDKGLELECYQFNSVTEPARIVYMRSRIAGLIPFEGRDKFQNGEGNMLIKLLKFITIDNNKGSEMNISALVTLLSEVLLVPTCVLQDYIRWVPIDSNTAKAIIKFKGTEVSGVFHFNDLGEYIQFDTNDRFQAAGKAKYKNVSWSVTAGDYIEKGGIKFPTALTALWHEDYGDFEYFKGRIKNIEFNVKEV